MANDMRTCKACGAKYQYCQSCAKYSHLPTWMWKCDTEKCNDVFDAVAGYKMNIKTVDDIKAALDKHSITDYSMFVNSIANLLNELFGGNSKRFKKNKNKNMDVVLNQEIEEPVIVEEISDLDGMSDL